jgi:LuxR family transcriptional regulator
MAPVYGLRDPVVAWALSEVGFLRWSAITLPDPFDILGQARVHGLAYGATVSTGPLDARTTAEAIQRAASCDLI